MTIESTTEENAEMTTTTVVEAEQTEQAESPGPNQEAAKYRLRLRDTEAQRDALVGERDNLARQLIEAQLPVHVTPDLFWQIHDVADFIANGVCDIAGVQTAVTEMAKRFRLTPAPYVPNQRGSMERTGNSGSDLEAAFSPRRDT